MSLVCLCLQTVCNLKTNSTYYYLPPDLSPPSLPPSSSPLTFSIPTCLVLLPAWSLKRAPFPAAGFTPPTGYGSKRLGMYTRIFTFCRVLASIVTCLLPAYFAAACYYSTLPAQPVISCCALPCNTCMLLHTLHTLNAAVLLPVCPADPALLYHLCCYLCCLCMCMPYLCCTFLPPAYTCTRLPGILPF